MGVFDSLISAGSNLIGGFLNREQQEDFNENQKYQAALNRDMQRQFAQEGIRWKVADAKAAGIHPLYALGANTVSYSPVSVGGAPDTSLGTSFANAGQDVSRAISATRTAPERADAYTKTVQDLSLTKMGLENDLLASQIRKLNQAGGNPPLPGGPFATPEDATPAERPQLGGLGYKWETYPGASNAEEAEKRYGDIGEEFAGIANFLQDLGYNIKRSDLAQMLVRPFNAAPSIYRKSTRSHQEWQR